MSLFINSILKSELIQPSGNVLDDICNHIKKFCIGESLPLSIAQHLPQALQYAERVVLDASHSSQIHISVAHTIGHNLSGIDIEKNCKRSDESRLAFELCLLLLCCHNTSNLGLTANDFYCSTDQLLRDYPSFCESNEAEQALLLKYRNVMRVALCK